MHYMRPKKRYQIFWNCQNVWLLVTRWVRKRPWSVILINLDHETQYEQVEQNLHVYGLPMYASALPGHKFDFWLNLEYFSNPKSYIICSCYLKMKRVVHALQLDWRGHSWHLEKLVVKVTFLVILRTAHLVTLFMV